MTRLSIWQRKLASLLVMAGFLAGFLHLMSVPALAAEGHLESNPWQEAQAIRDHLFASQASLVGGDLDGAQLAIQAAREVYQASDLATAFANLDQPLDGQIIDQFALAQAAASQQSLPALASHSSQIWTAILRGTYLLTLQSIQLGDVEQASQWLHVREYRPPTRFSRASADATLALKSLAAGDLDTEQTLAQVRADLLDTYQSSLGSHLATLREALDLDLAFRAADAAGSIYGYWLIIGEEYRAQFGDAAYQLASTPFVTLLDEALSGDQATILTHTQQIESIVQSFRAAPLTEEEQARRAGQMLRFLSLVPVEYGRGIKNGEVFLDIELQEAITFLEGAQAAFLDLRLNLEELDSATTAAVAADMAQLKSILDQANRRESVADPDVIKDTTAAITDNLKAMLPEAWTSGNTASDLDVLYTVLDQIDVAVAEGQYALAESARLEAYALLDLSLEPRLLAFAPDLAAELEGLFWQGYEGKVGLAQVINTGGSLTEIRAARALVDEALAEAQKVLGGGPAAPAVVVTNAAIIVFREGLEAVVIIAALMAGMADSYSKYRRPLALGAALAFLATALTFWLAQKLLANFAQYGERLEAVVSLVAIAILLMITNWFFHKSYWTDWLASFHKMKYRLIKGETGQMLGLVVLGFSSIYREGFETVLFLQALVLDAGNLVVIEGVALGLLAVFFVGFLIFRMQAHIPYMRLFVFTAFLIGIVLLILVGKTVHVMQAVGWMPISPIAGLQLPFWAGQWFGIFPTWESVIWQLLAFIFVVGSYYLAEYMRKRVRRSAKQKAMQA